MPTGSWATKIFDASKDRIVTFKGLANTANLKTEETEVPGGKASLTVKGESLETMTLTVYLNHKYVNVADEIKSWKELQSAKTAYPFLIGNEVYGPAKWLLTQVAVSDLRVGPRSIMMEATLSLTFAEDNVAAPVTKGAKGSRKKKTATKTTKTKLDLMEKRMSKMG